MKIEERWIRKYKRLEDKRKIQDLVSIALKIPKECVVITKYKTFWFFGKDMMDILVRVELADKSTLFVE